MERNNGAVVDLVVVVVKGAIHLRGINRKFNLDPSKRFVVGVDWSSKEGLCPGEACIRSVRS